ncbi:MAG TPA: hypothetical protein VFY99_07995 [Solirubrobacterales bacterium]
METKEHKIQRGPDSIRGGSVEDERTIVASLDRRRLLELAGAIRAHEARVRGQVANPRAHDLALYRRLRQIGGAS